MNIQLALKNKLHLDESHIVVAYNGYLSEKVLVSLAEILSEKLQIDQLGPSLTKRAFGLFCEQAQNVIRYSADRFVAGETEPVQYGNGLLTVGYTGDNVYILCGNLIEGQHQQVVEQRLNELQNMSDKELRKLYRQKLKDESDEQSKGASVGLIEIMRRSTHPVEYDFISYNDTQVFFCIKAYA